MIIFGTLLVRFIENALDKTLNAFLYGLGTSMEFVLQKRHPSTNCRDNRHLISTRTHKHSLHAESNLEQRFLRSREKSEPQSKTQGPKLHSKVLAIEPNRLL